MESPPQRPDANRPPGTDADRGPGGPVARSRPSKGGALKRISEETRGIVLDLREWIDLRLDLVVRELNDSLDDAASQAVFGVILALLGFFTGLFGLTALAIGLGWALGHPFWGFLIVFGILAIATFVVMVVMRRHPIVVETKLFRQLRGERYRDSSASNDSRPDDRADPARTDPARTDPARTDPARTDPTGG